MYSRQHATFTWYLIGIQTTKDQETNCVPCMADRSKKAYTIWV